MLSRRRLRRFDEFFSALHTQCRKQFSLISLPRSRAASFRCRILHLRSSELAPMLNFLMKNFMLEIYEWNGSESFCASSLAVFQLIWFLLLLTTLKLGKIGRATTKRWRNYTSKRREWMNNFPPNERAREKFSFVFFHRWRAQKFSHRIESGSSWARSL